MCDQGHILIFSSKYCGIRKEGTNIVVAMAARTPNNIYIFLNDNGKENCCLRKEDESWLWHKRVGHRNFHNLIKISKKEVVGEMSEITKPANAVCKKC
jgi:hypothetical protein